jgi:KipI family sensor histidine kinase inhibitor
MYAEPRFLLAGDSALVAEFGDKVSPDINMKVRKLFLYLEKFPPKGIKETVPTYRSLMIHYNSLELSLETLRSELEKAIVESANMSLLGSRRITVPVKYGGDYGPDIEDVAAHNEITPEDVIRIHSSMDYLVYMIGFTPGFPYLGELPRSIACPRLTTPRVKVPAGSIGIAGTLTGIYSLESPGGWRLIGRTPLKLFDERSDPPSLLQAGDYVRFLRIAETDYENILKEIQVGKYQPEIQHFEKQ